MKTHRTYLHVLEFCKSLHTFLRVFFGQHELICVCVCVRACVCVCVFLRVCANSVRVFKEPLLSQLRDLGFTNIDALDQSAEMLAHARHRGVYRNFYHVETGVEPIQGVENGEEAQVCREC